MIKFQFRYIHARGVKFNLAWHDYYHDRTCCEIDGPYTSQTCTSYIAFDERQRIAGVLVGEWDGHTWTSHGTLVRPRWRKMGVASQLWENMIEEEKPRSVYVTLVSDRGMTLIGSLKQKYPAIRWEIYDHGARPLRHLKKRKKP